MADEKLAAIIKKYSSYPEFLGIEIVAPDQAGAMDDTLLHLTARRGAVEDLEILLKSGGNVDVRGDLGNTPLHGAAMTGQLETAKLLLRHGANPAATNEFGQTPEKIAELGAHHHVVKLLKSVRQG